MRIYTKIGDIYSMDLNEKEKFFFQYIAKDKSCLNSDVIRLFKGVYEAEETPDVESIIGTGVKYYWHTSVRLGLKMGVWNRIGYSSQVGDLDIYFRREKDCGGLAKLTKPKRWVIWKLNGEDIIPCEDGDIGNTNTGMVIHPGNMIKWYLGIYRD